MFIVEKGLEIFLSLMISLPNQKLQLSDTIFSYGDQDRLHITRGLNVTNTLIGFEYNRDNKLLETLDEKLSPQELFFIFLCKKSA